MLYGKKINLRPATVNDRRSIYEWMSQSDCTQSFMGLPRFPDIPVPTWDEFCADYKPYYFDGSSPEKGRCYIIMADDHSVGQVNYNDIDSEHNRTELDIWMSCEANCGKRYGSDALQVLCTYLYDAYGVSEFIIRSRYR